MTTVTKKCSGKCMKPEPSEVKTEQSIKTGFNLTSQRFSTKWTNLKSYIFLDWIASNFYK